MHNVGHRSTQRRSFGSALLPACSLLIQLLIFGDVPELYAILGVLCILGSGVANILLEQPSEATVLCRITHAPATRLCARLGVRAMSHFSWWTPNGCPEYVR